MSMIELNERSEYIFSYIVENYLRMGMPIGSKQVLADLALDVSSATIRNVMASLESQGLIIAPHTSAGRIPTSRGLKFYIDGLMEIGDLDQQDKAHIDQICAQAGETTNDMLNRAGQTLSGLSQHLGLVLAPKLDKAVRQIQFVKIAPAQALVVIVSTDGLIENRLIELDKDVSESELQRLSNFINELCAGRTIGDISRTLADAMKKNRIHLDQITTDLVTKGLAVATTNQANEPHLIIKGQSKLLEDVQAIEDVERARDLFTLIEDQQRMMQLVQSTSDGDGVKVYLGAENDIFNHAGWSMMIAPYKNADNNIIGALGVIGPTRLNYGRIIPILDYTSRVLTKLIG
ncbi:MAG: heat-inducible transcriptional repressor HrcA [Alphaproteobacteria bacterium]|nr:heat-inducible transcriptional repressor HrcA [Alphaproteobacteria bacterium]